MGGDTIYGCAGLLGALGALRKSLNVKGSGLVVRYGALPKLLRELVLETGAGGIIAEEEVEHRYSYIVDQYAISIGVVSADI